MEMRKAELPHICACCGYDETTHNSVSKRCPQDPTATPSSMRRSFFEPVRCDCGDPAMAGLKSAPRCEWCLAGPKGLFEAQMFVIHARDYVAARMNDDGDWHAAYQREVGGYGRAYTFLDRAAEHLGWLLATAGRAKRND